MHTQTHEYIFSHTQSKQKHTHTTVVRRIYPVCQTMNNLRNAKQAESQLTNLNTWQALLMGCVKCTLHTLSKDGPCNRHQHTGSQVPASSGEGHTLSHMACFQESNRLCMTCHLDLPMFLIHPWTEAVSFSSKWQLISLWLLWQIEGYTVFPSIFI